MRRGLREPGQKLHEAISELAELDAEIKEVEKSRRREERYATKRKERVDEGLEQGSTRTVKFKQAVQEMRDSTKALEDTEDRMNQLQAKWRKAKQQKSKAERQIEKWQQQAVDLIDLGRSPPVVLTVALRTGPRLRTRLRTRTRRNRPGCQPAFWQATHLDPTKRQKMKPSQEKWTKRSAAFFANGAFSSPREISRCSRP